LNNKKKGKKKEENNSMMKAWLLKIKLVCPNKYPRTKHDHF